MAWLLTAVTVAAKLILQAFRCFTYVTAHSPTLPSLYLRRSSFSNPSVASPTSQFILQAFFRFSFDTGFSLTSPGEPPILESVNSRAQVTCSCCLCVAGWLKEWGNLLTVERRNDSSFFSNTYLECSHWHLIVGSPVHPFNRTFQILFIPLA